MIYVVPFASSAIEFVAESDCITTTSERFARRLAARFALQVLPPPLDLPSCHGSQVWHPRFDADPAHAWLRRLVVKVAREHLRGSRRSPT